MMGQLIAVVGPSGAGKDTLIDAARTARPDLLIVRRVITRPTEAGGEDFEGITEAEFTTRKTRGEFALDWRAHGLRYGLPALQIAEHLAGRDVLFNGSRYALDAAATLFPHLRVIRVSAPSAVLRDRLLARGRETAEEIDARIARASYDVPAALRVTDVVNGGPLSEGVARFLAALQPVNA
ncbi:phosphonate metabolism protein/1,5-bisphosphokinase (PRPP-forming) PhnN [Tabrizicola sp. M-4]|uniref:phosphonate metabolism protein/1,5-bisphosphokinase (PRPP-forming) PhnN n=1 Tax=Tabrizicola sp. M-4 TaxID=3055847 RepID=UPI003DA9A3C2